MSLAVLFVLVALFIKHFVVDFLLQPAYMYKNKGTLNHPGGWIHAGLHGFATMAILAITNAFVPLSLPLAMISMIMEIFVHYAMDYTKVNVCKKNGYTPTTHKEWFTWLGLDQTVHSLTYIAIVAIMFL